MPYATPTLTLLGVTVYPYGLMLAAGALVYFFLCGYLRHQRRLPVGTARVFAAFCVPLSLLCARLVFCLVNLSYYVESISQPLMTLSLWDGGYAMLGVPLGVFLAALIAAKIRRVSVGELCDVVFAPLGLFVCAARLGERFTMLGVGKPVFPRDPQLVPFLYMQDMGETCYAVYMMEAIVAFLIAAGLIALLLSRKTIRQARRGDVALLFLAVFGAMQVALESMRNDGHMLWGFVRASQVLSILLPIAVTAVWLARYARVRGFGALPIVCALVIVACVVCGILLEFSLDGSADPLRDTLLMFAVSFLLWLTPYVVFLRLRGHVYAEDRFAVKVGAEG